MVWLLSRSLTSKLRFSLDDDDDDDHDNDDDDEDDDNDDNGNHPYHESEFI